MNQICAPTEHNFKLGGDGGSEDPEERWEAWLFCGSCGAIGMVPEDAHTGVTIVAPKDDGQGS